MSQRWAKDDFHTEKSCKLKSHLSLDLDRTAFASGLVIYIILIVAHQKAMGNLQRWHLWFGVNRILPIFAFGL
jgi:hypothetical protein